MTAMIRHLPRFTNAGLFKTATHRNFVVDRLTDESALKAARIHPLQILVALRTYASGQGLRGKGTWTAVHQVIDALDSAFDLAFQNVKPTGKRYLLGVDVSGSMTWGQCAGMPITPNEAAAAMAMQAVRCEKDTTVMAFAHTFRKLPISARMRLDDVLKATSGVSFGGTNCSLPMEWALKNKLEVDTFVVYTDSETWCGRGHPFQALQKYRDKMGIPARLAVVAFVSSNNTIADPKDPGMLDIVGFDTATPSILSQFSEGRI
jgi:60 kDa SS-A/Ro ribonucleoprotein